MGGLCSKCAGCSFWAYAMVYGFLEAIVYIHAPGRGARWRLGDASRMTKSRMPD